MAKNDAPAAKVGTAKDSAATAEQGQQAGKTGGAESTVGLAVTSTRDGFRRAGLVWSKETTVIPMGQLTQEQLEALKNEPLLSLREVEIKAEAEDE